jgi:hypothetical protein
MDATRLNAAHEQRIRKEFDAEVNAKGRDPFATTLASLVGGLPESQSGKGTPAAPASRISVAVPASRISAASGRGSQGGAGSACRQSRASAGASQLSTQQQQRQQQTGDDGTRSQLSKCTSVSWRTPSSIRSDEPSEIARNKIAELQCAPRRGKEGGTGGCLSGMRPCDARLPRLSVRARAGCA